jgi:hypothetical protein
MSAGRSRVGLWLGIALAAIVLLAAAPVISVLLASGISDALGCTLNEGGSNPCRLMGIDIGDTLSVMFVFGWLALDTLPLGALAFLIWLVVAAIAAIVGWRRRHRAAT